MIIILPYNILDSGCSLKALGTMASQVLKHLQTSGTSKNLINDAKIFEAHRN